MKEQLFVFPRIILSIDDLFFTVSSLQTEKKFGHSWSGEACV